ncbi:lytic polysaccharide monooxygenase [Amniculicola lignicola CBS 123094]|uniref:Lytic polysaccharide monooxygenase n=1 Tax=Amniculicola lignicola CBS 123094 TaxID=1392246 RepID=A0A6A5WSN7_9PLEO|nr:lytic polysaccharide monooxygenase [Amniculicola lignicola CBS 123094]
MFSSIAIIAAIAPLAFAHSHVDEIWANNIHYTGYNPNGFPPYPSNTPGWFTTNSGGNPLYPVNTTAIICGVGGSPANISAPVAAGGIVRARWWQPGEWPVSHHGPVLDYLAPCNGPCSKVNPESLKFVKIDQRGWLNTSTWQEGTWAADELRADDQSWNIKIPAGLKAGEYILRHEIIALHVAFEGGAGAEHYPQCINLKVTGSGTKTITGGVDARTFYRGDEPGLDIDIHTTNDHSGYVIPGPPVWSGAVKKDRSFEA